MLILSVLAGRRTAIICALFIAATVFFVKKLNTTSEGFISKKERYTHLFKVFMIIAILLGFTVKLVYSSLIEDSAIADALLCFNAAQQAANGDFSWISLDYFQRWAYQIPFVLYETAVLKIFGNYKALYIMGAVFSILTCMLFYAVSKKMVKNENAALAVTALFTWMPNALFQIDTMYNQLIGGLFLMLSIYFFSFIFTESFDEKINPKQLLFCLLTGIFSGISNLFRAEAIVEILAVACYLIFVTVTQSDKKTLLKYIIKSVVFFAVFFIGYKVVTGGTDWIITASGIHPYGIKNRCPYWFIVCGLTPESYGAYSEKYIGIVYTLDSEAQKKMFSDIMHEIFADRSFFDILIFFAKKLSIMWGTPEEPHCMISDSALWHRISYVMVLANHYIYMLFSILAIVGIKMKKFRNSSSFLTIYFMGYFCIYLIKEIAPRYRYSTLFILALLSVYGIQAVFDYKNGRLPCNNKIKNKLKNHLKGKSQIDRSRRTK
ncbi:MAG: glycosyltransferase family 39 protein [Clostridia bacterium]|nr:glycosyltransferase family 39 protein [Clostridia bacterium]